MATATLKVTDSATVSGVYAYSTATQPGGLPSAADVLDPAQDANDRAAGLTVGGSLGPWSLTDLPSDFVSLTALSVTTDHRAPLTNDTYSVYVRVYESDGTTPLTNEVLVRSQSTAWTDTSQSTSLTGLLNTSDKTKWDGAKIGYRLTVALNMGADATPWLLDSVSLTATYVAKWTGAQVAYRWFADDAAIDTSTAVVAQDTPYDLDIGGPYRQLRVRIDETMGGAGGSTSDDYPLQFRVNGGAWTNVTTTSTGVTYKTSAHGRHRHVRCR
jgi:hypothetical protein